MEGWKIGRVDEMEHSHPIFHSSILPFIYGICGLPQIRSSGYFMTQRDAATVRSRLIELSREFGQARWAILGEGNTSGRIDQNVFTVKSSGSSLGTLREIELTDCYFDKLLPALDRERVSEQEIEEILLDSRVRST